MKDSSKNQFLLTPELNPFQFQSFRIFNAGDGGGNGSTGRSGGSTGSGGSSKFSMLGDSLASFDCLAINVTGEGIPSLDDGKDFNDSSDETNCTYPGIVSNFLSSAGGDVELEVPSGSERLIQVIGLKMSGACPIGKNAYEGSEDNSGETMYVVGSTTTDLFSDTSIGIENTYESGVTGEFCAGSSGSSTVLPTDFNNLVLWLDANELSLSNAASVSTWSDNSGYGNDATTSSTDPTFDVDDINGNPAVYFDGSDDSLVLDTIADEMKGGGSDQPFSIIIVAKWSPAPTSLQTVIGFGNTGDALTLLGLVATSGAQLEMQKTQDGGSSGHSGFGGTVDANPTIVSVTHSGINVTVYQDGLAIAGPIASDVGNATFDIARLGAVYQGGGPDQNFFKGFLGEVIIYDAELGSIDRSSLECALGTKWGITVSGC